MICLMSEKLSLHESHEDQLHFLYTEFGQRGIFERLGFDPDKHSLTPEPESIGFTLAEYEPRGLDITNTETGRRYYITRYTDPEKEMMLKTAFDLHNSQEHTEERRGFFPYFVMQRVSKTDPELKYQAYFIPSGLMPFENARYSNVVSDEEAERIKAQFKHFKIANILGSKIRDPNEFSERDVAVLISEMNDKQLPQRRGFYTIPRSVSELRQFA